MHTSQNSSQITRLCNAAIETAARNANAAIGPDHLLYVICSTQQGRKEIEIRGGNFRRMLNYLKTSFMSRQVAGGVLGKEVRPDFNAEFQEIFTETAGEAQLDPFGPFSMSDVVDRLINRHKICAITTAAMIQGGLIDKDEGDAVDNPDIIAARLHLQFEEDASLEDQDDDEDNEDDDEDDEDASAGYKAKEMGTPGADILTRVQPGAGAQGMAQDGVGDAVKKALRNITALAKSRSLDLVVGRDVEVGRICEIIQRRQKGSVLLLGEPGVGKTAIVEGLAQLLVSPDAPAALKDRQILEVSMADLLSGTKYRGDFEQRMSYLIGLATRSRAILFIDEAHTLMGAGNSQTNTVDAANFLKPGMARGDVKIILATTSGEARPIRKDKAMMRRLETVMVDEPSQELAERILIQAEKTYSAYHGISYEVGVARECVELSNEYMSDRRLPDKALDLLDAAAVQAKAMGLPAVSSAAVRKAVKSVTGIEIGKPSEKTVQVAREFPARMRAMIFGQDKVIDELTKTVRRNMAGVSGRKVAGTYLFNGPTGVGKTEAAKAMAKALKLPMVRIDMSEFSEAHTVSALIGAPPGYVGYAEDGALIAAAEAHPELVLLLDEVEKAHPKIFDVLLQVLDEGRVTSGDGRTVSLRGAHIIMTGNVGAREADASAIGYGRKTNVEEVTNEALKGAFRKELLARVRCKIHFARLTDDAVLQMCEAAVEKLRKDLKLRGYSINIAHEVVAFAAAQVDKDEISGRLVANIIETAISDVVAEYILENPEVTAINIKKVNDAVIAETFCE